MSGVLGVFEREVTHLLRCRKICNPHNRYGCSGYKFFCALHMGNFSSRHRRWDEG